MSMTIGAIFFGIGSILAALGGLSFIFRAIANKPAWGGATRPLLLTGVLVLVVGLGIIILTGIANGQFK